MRTVGGEVLTTENAREFSSAAKGETLEGEFPLIPFPVCCTFFPKRFLIIVCLQIQSEQLRVTLI